MDAAAAAVVQSVGPKRDAVYIIHNYSFKIFHTAYNRPMSSITLTPRALYQEVAEGLRQRIFCR